MIYPKLKTIGYIKNNHKQFKKPAFFISIIGLEKNLGPKSYHVINPVLPIMTLEIIAIIRILKPIKYNLVINIKLTTFQILLC